MRNYVAPLGLALLSACTHPTPPDVPLDDKVVTFNNFEGGGGWSNDPGRNNPDLVVRGLAHSGQYAIVADQQHEFSLTYAMPLGRMRAAKFRQLRIEAWAYLPSAQASGHVGLQLLAPDNGPQVFSDELKLGEVVKTYGAWVPISKDVTLPDSAAANQQLRLFLWRADASERVLLDDVKLSILD